MPKHTLLVEDDPEMRAQLAAVLERDETLELLPPCATLGEALNAVKREKPDILVTDIKLPDGEGYEAIKAVRAQNESAIILVISVLGDEAALTEAIEAGADGYLLKDASEPDVIAAIREAEAGGAPISAMMARHLLKRFGADKKKQAAVLTAQEKRVLEAISRGYTYRETAELLGVSPNTVPSHVKNIYRKLHVNSGSQAVMEGLRRGIIDMPS